MSKDILVINTRGNNETYISDFAGDELADLLPVLDKHGITYSGKTLSIGETSETLIGPRSPLPSFNFTLYVFPVKNDAGWKINSPLN